MTKILLKYLFRFAFDSKDRNQPNSMVLLFSILCAFLFYFVFFEASKIVSLAKQLIVVEDTILQQNETIIKLTTELKSKDEDIKKLKMIINIIKYRDGNEGEKDYPKNPLPDKEPLIPLYINKKPKSNKNFLVNSII